MTPPETALACSRCGKPLRRAFAREADGSPACSKCHMWNLQSPAALANKRRILEAVRAVEPGLPEEKILAAIDGAARNLRGLTRLSSQVDEVPGLLAGSSAAMKGVHRLVSNLLEAGAKNVAPPRCASCEKEAPLRHKLGDRRICAACYRRRSRMDRCSRCGRRRYVVTRTDSGEPLCGTCRVRDPKSWEECALCGEVYRVNARTEDGGAICTRCYRSPLDVCDACGEQARITSRKGGKAVCSRCYEHPKRPCGRCGRVRRIYRRATGEDPDLCHACWWEPIAICHRCGEEGMCNGIKKGEPLCLRCRLADRVEAALAGPDGDIPAALLELRDTIVSVGNPRSAHGWLNSSPAVGVLRRLAKGELALTHEALDALPQSPSLIHLRDLLIASGALPERDPRLARLEASMARQAASIENPEDAYLLKTFGTWRVTRRLRRRMERGMAGVLAAENAGRAVAEAARFIRWLSKERGKRVAECSQADVDEYLSEGAKARFVVGGFISWAMAMRAMGRLSVPALRRGDSPARSADLEGRVNIAHRLLHDDALDPADRVVGALVVIYAQPISRICRLTLDDVTLENGDVFVRFGREVKEAVLMPEPLGSLLRKLPWRRQIGISGKLVEDTSRWLFPGRQAGRHQHPEYLRMRLKKLGIESRPSRNAALIQLAAEIPAVVLADTLGIHPKTAADWAEKAGGNWSNYAALRTRDDRP